MVLIEALLVLGLLGLLVFGAVNALGGRGSPPALGPARWETAHYADGHATKVVVRKVVPGPAKVVDEHVIAVIPDDDPEYDARFLEAMAQARMRLALFESEGS